MNVIFYQCLQPTYVFIKTAVFQLTYVSRSILVFLLHLFQKSTFEDVWHGFFIVCATFLPLNQQCQSTAGNTKHWPHALAWPHPFFIHHCTSAGRSVHWSSYTSPAMLGSCLQQHARNCHSNNFMFMVTLWNRADHYIFMLWFLSIFFFSSPNVSGRTLDVYHTSTHGVALVRI